MDTDAFILLIGMPKIWKIHPKIEAGELEKFPEINPVILQLLWNREIKSSEEIEEFLNPLYNNLYDPFLFADMKKIIARIFLARKKKEKVAVYGDYDADGVTASAILAKALGKIGIIIEIYIPHRENEGYGLNEKAIEYLAKRGVKLIITVDTGITASLEVEFAKKKNMEVIITDHHLPPEETPKCLILDAHKKGEKYPFKMLAGAGVAFKLAQAIFYKEIKENQEREEELKAAEKWLLDIAAIGTIADCVPLRGENRILAHFGIIVLNKTKNYGLKRLILSTGSGEEKLESRDVSFRFAPRLNAAGRMDHANLAYELIMADNPAKARALTQKIEESNKKRQTLTEKVVKAALLEIGEKPRDFVITVFCPEASAGIIGLIAGKISDFYNRPALAITKKEDNTLVGSGRSIPPFNLIENLNKVSHYFSHFGGHAQACGFTFANIDNLAKFKKDIAQIGKDMLSGDDLKQVIKIDAVVKLGDINWDFFREMQKFSPFGQENNPPIFMSRNLKVLSSREVGQNGKHLKLMLNSYEDEAPAYMGGIGFNLASNFRGKLKAGNIVDLVYFLEANYFNGESQLQLKVVDLKIK